MLLHRLSALGLLVLITGVAAGQSEYGLAYDTGAVNPDSGCPELQLHVPTPLFISLVNNSWEDLAIGGLVFDFAAPGGGLMWDLDGPDDWGFTADDGFIWEPWLDGSPHPVFQTNDYFATIDPPQTGFLSASDLFAFTVPAASSERVATLIVTGTNLGVFALVAGDASQILMGPWDNRFEVPPPIGGAVIEIAVVPEPATLGLLLLGALTLLRRRRVRNKHVVVATAC